LQRSFHFFTASIYRFEQDVVRLPALADMSGLQMDQF
jgi:hypothetical protein